MVRNEGIRLSGRRVLLQISDLTLKNERESASWKRFTIETAKRQDIFVLPIADLVKLAF